LILVSNHTARANTAKIGIGRTIATKPMVVFQTPLKEVINDLNNARS